MINSIDKHMSSSCATASCNYFLSCWVHLLQFTYRSTPPSSVVVPPRLCCINEEHFLNATLVKCQSVPQEVSFYQRAFNSGDHQRKKNVLLQLLYYVVSIWMIKSKGTLTTDHHPSTIYPQPARATMKCNGSIRRG